MLREAQGSDTRSPLTAAACSTGLSSMHLHILWRQFYWGRVVSWTHWMLLPCSICKDVDREQTQSKEKGSVSLHAHMLLWPRSSASWGGQTDDTLSLCSSFLFSHPSSICDYPHAHTRAHHIHIYTNIQMGTKPVNIQLWGSLFFYMLGKGLKKAFYTP